MVSRERISRLGTAVNQQFTRASSKIGLSNLPHQIHIMLLMNFVFIFGRQISFTYLTMFLSGKSQDGGLGFGSDFVGFMMMTGGLANTFALLVTGTLCDKFGRKRMMMAALIPTAVLMAAFSFIHTPAEFLLLYAATGILLALNDPAYGAMIADTVSPERREEVYGLSYMITNLGGLGGTLVGGVLIGLNGYQPLFIYSAFFVAISAIIVTLLINESSSRNSDSMPLSQFAAIFRDRIFILFCFMGAMTNLLYAQFYGLLSVYMTDYLGFQPIVFGILFSFNGALVIALQIPIRRGTMRIGPTKGFIIAQLLYAAGFTYFMFAKDFMQFALGVAVLTIGEITFVPASSGFVANLAPADMRGRYIAMLGLFFGIGGAIGYQISFSIFGTLVDKQLVWGILGLIGFATLIGYGVLFKVARRGKQRSK